MGRRCGDEEEMMEKKGKTVSLSPLSAPHLHIPFQRKATSKGL
jgi:hypothetical protein